MSEKTLEEAKELWKDADERLSQLREDAIAEARFSRLGEQWDEETVKKRRQEGKPIVTVNKLPSFIRQIVNGARMSRPSLQIIPVDGGADPATAGLFGDIIKHIERKSVASVAYDTSLDHAVTFGFGFFRLEVDYERYDSFDMGAFIRRVTDPTSVLWDVDTTAVDASDWRYAFVTDDMSLREFKERYPGAEPTSWSADTRIGGARDENVLITEYWRKTEKKEKLLLVQSLDGQLSPWMEKDLEAAIEAGQLLPGTFQVLRERDTTRCEVKQYVLSGDDILEENEWPGTTIPIFPVWGADITIDGERFLHSATHDALDSQRLYNLWRATTTELVALAPKVPYLVPQGGIPENERHKWETSNSRSWPYLEYNAYEGLPPPRRERGPEVPAAALQEAMAATDDMKNVTGIHDASLGLEGNETSGIAIQSRRRQGDVSNYHFIDNLTRAIESLGKVLVEIIPSLYGSRQVIRIVGDDGVEKIAQLTQGGGTRLDPVTGDPMVFDLTTGHYDVHAKAGAGYATSREHAVEIITQIIQSVPAAAPYVGDILLENMDFPGADKIAERLKAVVPQPMPQGMPGMPGPAGPMPMQPPQGVM